MVFPTSGLIDVLVLLVGVVYVILRFYAYQRGIRINDLDLPGASEIEHRVRDLIEDCHFLQKDLRDDIDRIRKNVDDSMERLKVTVDDQVKSAKSEARSASTKIGQLEARVAAQATETRGSTGLLGDLRDMIRVRTIQDSLPTGAPIDGKGMNYAQLSDTARKFGVDLEPEEIQALLDANAATTEGDDVGTT